MSSKLAVVVLALCAVSVHPKPLDTLQPQSQNVAAPASDPAELFKDPQFAAAFGAFAQQYKAASSSTPAPQSYIVTEPSIVPSSTPSDITDLETLLGQSQTPASPGIANQPEITQQASFGNQQSVANIPQPLTPTIQPASIDNSVTNQPQQTYQDSFSSGTTPSLNTQNQFPGSFPNQNQIPSQVTNYAAPQPSTPINPPNQYPTPIQNQNQLVSQTFPNNAIPQAPSQTSSQNQYLGTFPNQNEFSAPQPSQPSNQNQVPSQVPNYAAPQPSTSINTPNQYPTPIPDQNQLVRQTFPDNAVSQASPQFSAPQPSQSPNFQSSYINQYQVPSQTFPNNAVSQPTFPTNPQNVYPSFNANQNQFPNQIATNNPKQYWPTSSQNLYPGSKSNQNLVAAQQPSSPIDLQGRWASQVIANKEQWPPAIETTPSPSLPIPGSDPRVTIVFAPTASRPTTPYFEPLSPEAQKKQAESAKYQFSTLIDDNIKGSFIERSEIRDGLRVAGKYGYDDGHVRRAVFYIADDKGFRIVKEEVSPSTKTGQLDGTAKVQNYWDGNRVEYYITGKDIASSTQNPLH